MGHGHHLEWDTEDPAGWAVGDLLEWDLGGIAWIRAVAADPISTADKQSSTTLPYIFRQPFQQKSHQGLQHHPITEVQP